MTSIDNVLNDDKLLAIEKKVVASVLFSEEIKSFVLNNIMDVRIFRNSIHYKAINLFYSLYEGRKDPTFNLILETLRHDEGDEAVSYWRNYFEEAKDDLVDIETLRTYIQMLFKQYKIELYKRFADELKMRVDNERVTPLYDSLEEMDKEIELMFAQHLEIYRPTDRKDVSMAQGVQLVSKHMEDALKNDNDQMSPTGYEEIDSQFNGGHPKGTYTIYAGRPGSGKTLLMLNEALFSVKHNKDKQKSLFISIEMTAIQCFQRIIANLADIDAEKLQNPFLMTPSDWTKMNEVAEEVAELFDGNFWIIEVTQLNISRLRRIIQEYKKKYGLDTVYVDYAQIMSTEKGEKPETEAEYSAISEGLRQTAKFEMVAIVVGSQLSREVEKREDKRPKLSDLRNSGAFEQDAVRVIGIYRDEYYFKETTEEPGIMEYIVLKNRFGNTGTIKFRYDAPKQSILSMAA